MDNLIAIFVGGPFDGKGMLLPDPAPMEWKLPMPPEIMWEITSSDRPWTNNLQIATYNYMEIYSPVPTSLRFYVYKDH